MKSLLFSLGCLTALSSVSLAANPNATDTLRSKLILPSTFRPPQVFKNVNLVRNVNLDKYYARETINAVIENTDKKPQNEYYLPFPPSILSRVGGFEVRDKKDASLGVFQSDVVGYDIDDSVEYYRIKLPTPLKPSGQQTLSISYSILSPVQPLPKKINQIDMQYVQYTFNAYANSAYATLKQKTKLKFPSSNIPDYTKLPTPNADRKDDPQVQGSVITYGPYDKVDAGAVEIVTVRYEFTKPLMHATRLERDYEISHWGGNLATEERYWLTNHGAQLKNHFSRVQWQRAMYQQPPSSALRDLRMPLRVGSLNPYFIDDIGNVSTSRFRSSKKEANLELKPRYPIFGGWNYSFKVGWDGDLKSYLRKLKSGDGYVLQVPFLEGPKIQEGIQYAKVELRVILPEGAKNIKFETSVPIVSSEILTHRTFMDTRGRAALKLTAINLSDEWRDRDLIVTYDYPFTEAFRKPLTVFFAMISVFAAAWVIGNLDTSIGRKKK